LSDLHTSIG